MMMARRFVTDDPSFWAASPPRLRQSVRGLLALDFDTLLVGDGVPILQNAKEQLRELVESFPN